MDYILRSGAEILAYCKEKGAKVTFAINGDLPPYADDVQKFLRERALKDLPDSQFIKPFQPKELGDYVEMGGLLHFMDDALEEVSYVEPSTERVIEQDGKIISLGGSPLFLVNDFEHGGDMIDYHSHPNGCLYPSTGDIDKFLKVTSIHSMLKNINPNVGDAHFLIYAPQEGITAWYIPKPIQVEIVPLEDQSL